MSSFTDSISASIKAVKHQCLYLKRISHRNFSGCWKASCDHQCRTFPLLQGLFHFGNIHFHPQGKTVQLCSDPGMGDLLLFTVEGTAQPSTSHTCLITKSFWILQRHSKPCPAVSFIHVSPSHAKPQPQLSEQLYICNSNLLLVSQ